MASTNALPPKVEFLQNHIPALYAGDYIITVTQSISTKSAKIQKQEFSQTQNFSVYGERFSLNPKDIEVIFPKPGSTGEYQNILPHLVLKRSTLPWERYGDEDCQQDNEETPWLVLLLFAEAETPSPQIITVADLKTAPANGAKFPTVYAQGATISSAPPPWIELETEQQDTDKLTVIDVPIEILQKIMPKAGELPYLAHVRQGTDEAGNSVGDELAIVICNRLPQAGGRSTVHLVSVERRWNIVSGFDYQGATEQDKIRLVSLKSWQFYCSEHFKLTQAILNDQSWLTDPQEQTLAPLLNQEVVATEKNFKDEINGVLGGNVSDTDLTALAQAAYFKKTLEGLLLNLNQDEVTLRLPTNTDPTAESYLASGFVPVKHRWRTGENSYSWYHGPLVPTSSNFSSLSEPIQASDALLRYLPSIGMFDVSYAAAWELGRLLAVSDKDFSVKLYHYKRYYAQQQKPPPPLHLAQIMGTSVQQTQSLEADLLTWFKRLNLLQNVPFNYLVPDEQMLPPESIRFFYVDPYWISCLLDGAFSVGRATKTDYENDKNLMKQLAVPQVPYLSGFLLRSEAVAGWPGIIVDGYAEIIPETNPPASTQQPMPLHRYQLSDHVLLCLFEGTQENPSVKTVDIHQKPEVIHFGFDDDNEMLYKTLKDSSGNENPAYFISVNNQSNNVNGIAPNTVISAVNTTNQVVDITSLATTIKNILSQPETQLNFTPTDFDQLGYMEAVFAMEMTEGVVKIRFTYSG